MSGPSPTPATTPPPAPDPAAPIGPVGHHPLDITDLLRSYDHDTPVPAARFARAPARYTSPPHEHAHTLLSSFVSDGLVEDLGPHTPEHPAPNTTLRLQTKKSGKLQVITPTHHNLTSPEPHTFSLPSHKHAAHILTLDHLEQHITYLCKYDVSNFFPSLRLPPPGPGVPEFIFVADGRRYRLLFLPLGWKNSPHIAQRTLARLLADAMADFTAFLPHIIHPLP